MTSAVLTHWLAGRPGSVQRAGLQPGPTLPAPERAPANLAVSSGDSASMADLFAAVPSLSGQYVTDKTALQVSTVYACLTKLAGAIMQLPIEQYRLDVEGNRDNVARNNLWWLLNESPEFTWTAASWKEWIIRCVALRGDQHTEIVRDRRPGAGGAIKRLRVHHPDRVTPRHVATADGPILVYDCTDADGGVYTVHQDDMLHFAGFGFDGLRSLSMIQTAARNGIGNSLAAADYTGRSIGEGAMPQIAISYGDKSLAAEKKQALRDSFVATYGGGQGRKLPLVLTDGAKAETLSISPVDMQLLESRRFEREDICQAMGVPPILIGENEKTSSWGTGIEQITIGFVKYTIKAHTTRWAEELNRKLYRRAGTFCEFDLDELLAGDSKAQADYFKASLGGPGAGPGWMTVNEIRRAKNLPPLPNGNDIFYPLPGKGQPHENQQAPAAA